MPAKEKTTNKSESVDAIGNMLKTFGKAAQSLGNSMVQEFGNGKREISKTKSD